MNTSAPALLPLLPLLAACQVNVHVDEGNAGSDADGSADTASDAGSSTQSDTSSSTATSTSTDSSTTGMGTDTGTGDTGGPDFCGLSDQGPDTAWFELYANGVLLGPGGSLPLVCGGQGSFMLPINPELGGFVPETDSVPFHITLDVEGFNLGPDGHFAVWDGSIFVGCCDPGDYECQYYSTTSFYLFPPDQIPDMSVLHQLPATLIVTMQANAEVVEQNLDIQLWALDDGSWQFCMYYDVEELPLLPAGAAIPLD